MLVPDLTGLIVKAYESDADAGWTIENSELEISGYDMTVAGKYTVKIN